MSEQLQKLTEAMARTQAQVEQSQHELEEMRKQLNALQALAAQSGASATAPETASSSSSAPAAEPVTHAEIDDIRERQAVIESEIKTHEQTKVESESKYPVKITGLLLLNGFVNTKGVDAAATPTLAVGGPGNTGASVRQTVLGFSARGAHLFGAASYADLNIDFDGNPQSPATTTNYTGYNASNATLLRLRTAHAGLQWQHTQAYFSLDHPILSPDSPTSLTAVAEPALAWSGNLWTWNPQFGLTHDLPIGSHSVRLQSALIDVGDAPWSVVTTSAATGGTPATGAEQSRWPGAEARIALLGSKSDEGSHLGVGGYFSPHLNPVGRRFDAWAGTLDARLALPWRLSFTGSFYRGAALGGLGAGGFKDFGFVADPGTGNYYFRPYDDAGGWAQLKEKLSQRLELNAAFGLDNVFASQLRPYAVPGGTSYQNLARNRTYTGNVIYSPSAYLLFSLEYRHLGSSPIIGSPVGSNVIGLAAGYRF
ncbi:hypothetical protein [Granulicella aggregans]|uniref:hypothetical protein n=1 Tax=Granulicella aggregans TaxID=474949 RepID=UPI0021E05D23|nr:hypothetical protein [Granulicella aggregans]